MSDQTIRSPDTWEGPRNEGPGGQIGPYKLMKKLGEGGFGVVFEAEQEEPVKRRVALKVIKLGMDTAEVIVRFEAERQALAMMDHPHIATVLDAGATESGRPYFVMELVEGQSISEYCDANNLTVAARLELFDQVCTAVQHAHTKGIIHRDLKPSNVLVHTQDGEPFAKVIDFGIAKATSGRLTDKSLMTELHQVMGTPLYMSPEQAEGSSDIDTRTDIYSLGAMLYELLTGTTPVDSASMRSAVFAEVQRLICEVDPPLPSARLGQSATTVNGVASHRSMDSRKLTRMVKGDLDWIVMKALEKDRSRRYETANGLAMDLRRYLAHEPVLAAPPSASYRLQKFVRRNKGAVAAGSLVAASLLVGMVAFAWQARIAQTRAAELEQVSKFQEAMLAQVDPTVAGKLLGDHVRNKFAESLARDGVASDESAREIASFVAQWQRISVTDVARDQIDRTILNPAVQAINKQFAQQPLVDARLRQVLANRYMDIGMYDAALPLQRRALAIRRSELGNEAPETLNSLNKMGEVLLDMADYDGAEKHYREALDSCRRTLGQDHPETLDVMNSMGLLRMYQGKPDQAEPLLRQALAGRRRVLGEENFETIASINNLAALLQDQGKLEEAEPLMREVVAKLRHTLGNDNSYTLTSVNNLAALLEAEGKMDEAESYYREAVTNGRRVQGDDHPDTVDSINNLGVLLQNQGHMAEAESLQREVLDKRRKILGADHPNTLTAIANLGLLLQKIGKYPEAEALLRESVDRNLRIHGNSDQETLVPEIRLSALLQEEGKNSEAIALLVPIESLVRKAFNGDKRRRVASLLAILGKARGAQEDYVVAEKSLLEAQAIFVETRGPTHSDTLDCIKAIVDLYTAWNKAEPGKGYAAKAAEWKRKADEAAPPSG